MDGFASTACLIWVGRQYTVHMQAMKHRGASHLVDFLSSRPPPRMGRKSKKQIEQEFLAKCTPEEAEAYFIQKAEKEAEEKLVKKERSRVSMAK